MWLHPLITTVHQSTVWIKLPINGRYYVSEQYFLNIYFITVYENYKFPRQASSQKDLFLPICWIPVRVVASRVKSTLPDVYGSVITTSDRRCSGTPILFTLYLRLRFTPILLQKEDTDKRVSLSTSMSCPTGTAKQKAHTSVTESIQKSFFCLSN